MQNYPFGCVRYSLVHFRISKVNIWNTELFQSLQVVYRGQYKLLVFVKFNPFKLLIYHYHLYQLQAANCCRNSRLVVDEDDLK